MGRLNDVKMASFWYGLITFYDDVMETLYNVLITLSFCLLKTLLERFPRHSGDVLHLNTQVEPAVCLLSKHLKQSISNMLALH